MVECHPISGLLDPTGHSLQGVDGLMLMVHGHFEDLDTTKGPPSKRSFSRTFILGPGAPGGPPIRVVSDMMVLRAFSPLTIVETALLQAPTQLNQTTPIAQSAPSQMMQPMPQPTKEDVIRELIARTQMTPQYAELCLEQTGWDFEKALVAFNENKSKLPPDAFITMGTAGI
jgi:nuclear RNA export factor